MQLIWFSFIPTFLMLLGSVMVMVYRPRQIVATITQHFAAGVVFAAVAKELLPKIGAAHALLPLIVGFTAGMVLMFFAKWLGQVLESPTPGKITLPVGLMTSVAIDVFIDGVLIGIAFLFGEQGGVLVTIALAIELLFLGLSTSMVLNGVAIVYRLLIMLGLALLTPLGTFLGTLVFVHLSGSILNAVLAFGVAALLYLVTEELLVEAHRQDEKIWMPLFFFAGFLLILVLER